MTSSSKPKDLRNEMFDKTPEEQPIVMESAIRADSPWIIKAARLPDD